MVDKARQILYYFSHVKTIYPNSDDIAAEISEKLNEEFQKRGLTDEDFIELRYDFKIYPGIYTRFTSYDDADGATRDELSIPKDTLLKYHRVKTLQPENIPLDSVKESAKNYIVEAAYDPKYGARPLRRKIQNLIEDALAEGILDGTVKKGDTVDVTARGQKIHFAVKNKK